MYRVLADRLARAGIGVLRFDYFATGDSPGDDVEGELDGWTGDLAEAHEELLRRSRAGRTVWVGARLGATLAAMATHHVTRPPDNVVLWEPVVDGPAYLGEMVARHVQALEGSYHASNPPWPDVLASIVPRLEREGMGFELGESLRAQLGTLTPESVPAPKGSRCTMIEPVESPDSSEIVRRWKGGGVVVDEVVFAHEFDWMAPEALNTALVPNDAVQLLTRLAAGRK
jgi:hypothetical protein